MPAQPIHVRGRPLAGGLLPAVCAPLVGRTLDALLQEVDIVAAKQPDLLEWRVDAFERIADPSLVLEAAHALRARARGLPVLFTRRSQAEGGHPIAADEATVLAVYEAVTHAGLVDLVDYEMALHDAAIARVRAFTRAAGVGLVLSSHDFERTPDLASMMERLRRARALGADVAKIAVMPRNMEDVATLLQATAQASVALDIPVITMAMGPLGASTRVCGGAFGSALTFAVGASSSAPGQMPIEDVRAGVGILQRASRA